MADDEDFGSGGDDPKADKDGAGSNRNTALSLAQLIGAPIHALIEAEAQAAMATANFIRNVGFIQTSQQNVGELGELQMARFRRQRRNAQGEEETIEVEIPLLTLLPIPALQIRDAELEYTVKILDTELTRSESPEAQRAMALGLKDAPATLRATLARDTRNEQRRSLDMLLKMKVNIEQSDMPAGLAKLLNISTENINQRLVPSTVTPPPELPVAPPAETAATTARTQPGSGSFTLDKP